MKKKRYLYFTSLCVLVIIICGVFGLGMFQWYSMDNIFPLQFKVFIAGATGGLVGYVIEMFRWKMFELKKGVKNTPFK